MAGGAVSRAKIENWIELATKRLRHRGPDDDGLWLDVSAGFGVGHTRLSIIDLN